LVRFFTTARAPRSSGDAQRGRSERRPIVAVSVPALRNDAAVIKVLVAGLFRLPACALVDELL
jgi:hypothetical protein